MSWYLRPKYPILSFSNIWYRLHICAKRQYTNQQSHRHRHFIIIRDFDQILRNCGLCKSMHFYYFGGLKVWAMSLSATVADSYFYPVSPPNSPLEVENFNPWNSSCIAKLYLCNCSRKFNNGGVWMSLCSIDITDPDKNRGVIHSSSPIFENDPPNGATGSWEGQESPWAVNCAQRRLEMG